jgi:hypothetical protein
MNQLSLTKVDFIYCVNRDPPTPRDVSRLERSARRSAAEPAAARRPGGKQGRRASERRGLQRVTWALHHWTSVPNDIMTTA